MTINLFQTEEYKAIMLEHMTKTIGYLFNNNQDFSLVCEVKHITFSPELPKDLKENFNETVLFILSGYTLSSASIEKEDFLFEAGFGTNNFGSVVSVPLLAIKQVVLADSPVLINLCQHGDKSSKAQTNNNSLSKNSMQALLKNPKNKKLLAKKK